MKIRLCLLVMLFTGFAFAQERNSEKHTTHISFSQLVTSPTALEQMTNINQYSVTAQNRDEIASFLFVPKQIPIQHITPFLSFFCSWKDVNHDAGNTIISIRFSVNGLQWDEWRQIKPDEHFEDSQNIFIGELMYQDPQYRFYQLHVVTNQNKKGNLVQDLFVNFFSPGSIKNNTPSDRRDNSVPAPTANRPTACSCPRPDFITRIGWGCTQIWSPFSTTVTHLIVHHSAGVNVAPDWGAVVLSIWNFHTTPIANGGAGYSDIGYNWLIAPNGVLYEGRYKSSTDDITGAHFCGTNGNAMGVCMLGTYTSQTITPEARNTLIRTLAWKACQRNIDVTGASVHNSSGLTLKHISGHRDGCSTECPGNTLYLDLPGIRTAIKNYQDNGCTLTAMTNIEGLEAISVAPNPVKKNIILKLKLNAAKVVYYRILNADGKIIYLSGRQKMNGTTVTEITALQQQPAGNYIIQVWINGQSVSRHLIKQ